MQKTVKCFFFLGHTVNNTYIAWLTLWTSQTNLCESRLTVWLKMTEDSRLRLVKLFLLLLVPAVASVSAVLADSHSQLIGTTRPECPLVAKYSVFYIWTFWWLVIDWPWFFLELLSKLKTSRKKNSQPPPFHND